MSARFGMLLSGPGRFFDAIHSFENAKIEASSGALLGGSHTVFIASISSKIISEKQCPNEVMLFSANKTF